MKYYLKTYIYFTKTFTENKIQISFRKKFPIIFNEKYQNIFKVKILISFRVQRKSQVFFRVKNHTKQISFQMIFVRHTLVDLECYFLTRVSYPFLFCLFSLAYVSSNFDWLRAFGIQFFVRHSRGLVSALLFGPSCLFC